MRNQRVESLLSFFKDNSDIIIAIASIVSAILYMGAVSSRTTENSDRIDRQREHMIRTESEFRASFVLQQSQLTDLIRSTSRIEQYQKDHSK